MTHIRSFFNLIVILVFFQSAVGRCDNLKSQFLGSREGDPASLVENVSTIHGDYTEVEVDVVVPAPDSLILSRFYSSRDMAQTANFGGWRFNPHCFLSIQKDPKGKTCTTGEGKLEYTYVFVGTPEGSILTYSGWHNSSNSKSRTLFKIDPEEEMVGLSNTARGNISCWTNLKNNELYFNSQTDSFELVLSSEGRRFYAKHPSLDVYLITHEILPSGNKVFYEFDPKGELSFIKETNASEKKVLAWIKIQRGEGIHVQTSNGKSVDYHFQQDTSGVKLLTEVHRSDKPSLQYQYQVIDNHVLLLKKILPEGRFVQVDYHKGTLNQHKVRSVVIPTSLNETAKVQFFYEDNCTAVEGPGNRKVMYRFDDGFQLVATEQYLDGSPYRIHKKSWGTRSNAGNLISTSVEDENGNVFYHKHFAYDGENRGNIVQEKEYGDLSGEHAVSLSIGEDGSISNQIGHVKYHSYFSGKTTYGFSQKDEKGAGIKYWYKKGTNLLLKKLVLKGEISEKEKEGDNAGIIERHFYTYNEDAVLIRVVVDDGYKEEMDDYYDEYGVKQRLITYISPKQDLPNIGAPKVVEQKYKSQNKQSELLLKRTINEFDNEGNIVSQAVYDANEKHHYTVTKGYTNGLLAWETDPLGNETYYSYDANHNLIAETYTNSGISIEYSYDLRNHLTYTAQKDGSGNRWETQIFYDVAGYKIAETDRFGNETVYVNDDLGRPINVTYPKMSDGSKPTYTYAYDLFDNPISVTDPKGRTLKKSYNVYGKPTELHHLDGTKEILRYDSGGNLRQYCGRDGLLQAFSYDYMGRLNKIEYFDRKNQENKNPFKKKTYGYNAFHKIDEMDELENITIFTYDGAGRLATLEKEERKVEFLYDSLGRTHGVKRWKSAKTFTLEVKEYDLLDRVIEERIEDTQNHTLVKKKYVYNEAGQLAQIIGYPQNKESVLIRYGYDGFGRLSQATNAAGHTTTLLYDDTYINEWGQKTLKRTTIDPLGNQTEEIFDTNDNLIKITKKDRFGQLLAETASSYDYSGNKILEKTAVASPEASSRDYETERSFNRGDQLESLTLGRATPQERTHRFEYNAYGDLSVKYTPGSKEPITYRYNNRGDLDSIAYKEEKKETAYKLFHDARRNLIALDLDSTFTIDYSFDPHNLLLSEKIEDDFGSYQVSCTYDGEGKIKTLQFPDGSFVQYFYKGPFVKTAKRFNTEGKESYHYQITSRDQMGNILEEALPGNLGIRKQFWDEAGRRIEISTDFFQDKVLEDGYDPLENLTKRETTLEKEKYIADYHYDALSHLIAERGKVEYTYAYDSIGNRLKRDGSLYTVDEANQLIEAEGVSYTFDKNGNLATKTVDNKTWTYQSNPLNQIICITDPDQNKVKFTYDLSGRRLTKKIEAKGKKAKVLRFFYLGETEIGCLDEKGTIIELKIPSDPNHPESPCIAIEIEREIYVPLYDLQGNIACVLDHQKCKIVESYCYSAYREEKITNNRGKEVSNSSIGNPWRYRGKRIDKETGLIYFGYRYYSPEIGRWISPDPLGSIDGPNLYSYARNNPINYVDYFGFASEVNENQSCICRFCERGDRCHCLLGIDYPSCLCKGIFCDHKRARSIVTVGSKITSALGGISHGVVDFVVVSLHDLQTTAAYVGSGELDISLYERIQMIEAVEQSQANQMAKVEDWMMDMLSVDQSNTIYQSFRSKTTLGLEVGSLVVGGYGAVKGVVAFNRLARVPIQITNIASKASKSSLLNHENFIKKLEIFLGKDSRAFKNIHGDLLIESKDGLRQFRMDINNVTPHKNPHTHLIEYEMRKGRKFEIMNERNYPIDVNPE